MKSDSEPEVQTARLFVCLGFKDWAGALPFEAWTGEFELPDAETHNIRQEIESVKHGALIEYTFQETRGRTSWGADGGEVVRVALFVATSAASGIIGNAMFELLRSLAKRDRFGKETREASRPMSREEAVARATWILQFHYGMDAGALDEVPREEDGLKVVGEEKDQISGGWTIQFRDVRGAHYRVSLDLEEGLPSVSRIARWTDDQVSNL
jgi:hypothetical protein